MSNRSLWTSCGVAGMLSVACYLGAIFIPWPETQVGTTLGLLCVSAWPVLSIIYAYGLYHCIASESDGLANRLGVIFAALAFATVLAMIVVQMAVGAALPEITSGLDDVSAKALHRGLRMIDMGLDVAWDMLIGVSLIFSGKALSRHVRFGAFWGFTSMLLGAALILLNASTFPWPPADRGLFDIGPFIGLFILALAGRLFMLGRQNAAQLE